MKNNIHQLFYNKNLRYAVPFLLFVIGGSFGLREFTALRYKYRSVESLSFREEAKKTGIAVKKQGEVTLEKEYEDLKKVDIYNWENVRISRPKGWNENE